MGKTPQPAVAHPARTAAGARHLGRCARAWLQPGHGAHGHRRHHHGQSDQRCGHAQHGRAPTHRLHRRSDRHGPLHARRRPRHPVRLRAQGARAQSVRTLQLVDLAHGGGHEQHRGRRQRLLRQSGAQAREGRYPVCHLRPACAGSFVGAAGHAVLHPCARLHRRRAVERQRRHRQRQHRAAHGPVRRAALCQPDRAALRAGSFRPCCAGAYRLG